MEPRPERYILCLDDDRDFLKSLEVCLPDQINSEEDAVAYYHFVFLDNPLHALEALRDLVAEGSTVGMIITDQQMPAMKGTEFLLKAREISANSIRVLLTGHAGIEAAIGAINERLLERYLTKPIEDPHEFALNVRQLLQRFEMSRVIERQSATLQGLYGFANQINRMTDLQAMQDYVVSFTRDSLGCGVVHLEVAPIAGGTATAADSSAATCARAEASASESSAPTTGRVAEGNPAPAELDALVRGANLAPSTPAAYACMRAGDSYTGSILAVRGGQERFADHDLQTLGYIADTASTAIERQRMWKRLEDAYRVTKEQATHLEEANEKLILLDRMKGDFLRFVSHELRTPLGHLSTVSMLEGEADPKEQAELTSIIRQGYERLNRLIVLGLEYLDWSGCERVDSKDSSDLRAIVMRGVEAVQACASRKVAWDLSLPTEPCLVRMPSAQVEDIVRVLLDNALKFSGADPRVRVEVNVDPEQATFRVVDRGRGFPPELTTRIFEPFTVMDTTHYEGSALNLARIHAMVEAFGGTATATSTGLGDGATFVIAIPLARSAAQEQPNPPSLLPSVEGLPVKG